MIEQQSKNCRSCEKQQPLAGFNKHKGMKDGLRTDCKICCAAYAKRHREDNLSNNRKCCNKHRGNNPEKIKIAGSESNKKWCLAHPEKYMLRAARQRARNANIPFEIQEFDIVIPKLCPVLEIPLFRKPKSVGPNSPSLDRIVPNLGYVKGNIMVISNLANTMKSNATLEQCVKLGQFAARQIESADYAKASVM